MPQANRFRVHLLRWVGIKPHDLSKVDYLTKVSHDVFEIVDHRDDSRHVRLFSETIGHKNNDHTVSLLQEYIEGVKKKHTWLEQVPISWTMLPTRTRIVVYLGNGESKKKCCEFHPLL